MSDPHGILKTISITAISEAVKEIVKCLEPGFAPMEPSVIFDFEKGKVKVVAKFHESSIPGPVVGELIGAVEHLTDGEVGDTWYVFRAGDTPAYGLFVKIVCQCRVPRA